MLRTRLNGVHVWIRHEERGWGCVLRTRLKGVHWCMWRESEDKV